MAWSVSIPNPLQVGGNGAIGEIDILDESGSTVGEITENLISLGGADQPKISINIDPVGPFAFMDFDLNLPDVNPGQILVEPSGQVPNIVITGPSLSDGVHFGATFLTLAAQKLVTFDDAFISLSVDANNGIDNGTLKVLPTAATLNVPLESAANPGWVAPASLANGWHANTAAQTPQLQIIPTGPLVVMRGILAAGTTTDNTVVMSVPTAYIPSATRLVSFAAGLGSGTVSLTINTTGTVQVKGLSATTVISLDGVFYAL